jgi:putative membrane protein
MRSLLLRVVVTGLAVWLAAFLVPGVRLTDGDAVEQIAVVLVVAIIFGLVNAVLGGVLRTLTLPLTLLTLGLFALVVNALLFWLTGAIASALELPFEVDGFLAALLGAIVVSLVRMGLRGVARE